MINTVLLGLSTLGMVCITIIIAAVYPDQFDYHHHFPPLIIFGAINGLGTAILSLAMLQTSYWYTQQKQLLRLNLIGIISTLAPGLFTFFVPVFIKNINLYIPYLIWICILVIGNGIQFVLGKDSPYYQVLWELKKKMMKPNMGPTFLMMPCNLRNNFIIKKVFHNRI